MRVILVSGTRSATPAHLPTIRQRIKEALRFEYVMAELVHGDAPGLDKLVDGLARQWRWRVSPVPADWATCDLTVPPDLGGCPDWVHRKRNRRGDEYCPYAGNRRNQVMADRRPKATDVLGFPAAGPKSRSRGTWDLLHRAKRAGLNVHKPCPLEVSHA